MQHATFNKKRNACTKRKSRRAYRGAFASSTGKIFIYSAVIRSCKLHKVPSLAVQLRANSVTRYRNCRIERQHGSPRFIVAASLAAGTYFGDGRLTSDRYFKSRAIGPADRLTALMRRQLEARRWNRWKYIRLECFRFGLKEGRALLRGGSSGLEMSKNRFLFYFFFFFRMIGI